MPPGANPFVFEQQSGAGGLFWPMKKLIALVAAGLFTAGTLFAGEHGDCAKQVGNDGKMACTVALADLNLTPDQQKEDGCPDGGASQGRVQQGERSQIHGRGQIRPQSGAIREIQSALLG